MARPTDIVERCVRTFVVLALAGTTLYVLWFTYTFGQERFFTIDEYQWGHASWLVATGQIPYRDFYEHHLPLGYLWFHQQRLDLLVIDYLGLESQPADLAAAKDCLQLCSRRFGHDRSCGLRCNQKHLHRASIDVHAPDIRLQPDVADRVPRGQLGRLLPAGLSGLARGQSARQTP